MYLCAIYTYICVRYVYIHVYVCNVFISQYSNHVNIVLIIAQSTLTSEESLAILGTLPYNYEHFPRVIIDMIQN